MLEKTNAERSKELDVEHLGIGFPFKSRYSNFINGKFQAPKAGRYFDNHTPITGEFLCEVARSDSNDIECALDAAHAAFSQWGKSSPTDRAKVLNKIADVMEENLHPVSYTHLTLPTNREV